MSAAHGWIRPALQIKSATLTSQCGASHVSLFTGLQPPITYALMRAIKGDPGTGGVTPDAARSIASEQDAVLVYDFDSIVKTNLGV